MSQSITEGKYNQAVAPSFNNAPLRSLWGVPYREDTTRTYHECSGPATTGLRWCCGEGALGYAFKPAIIIT